MTDDIKKTPILSNSTSKEPSFQILHQYLKDLSFENPSTPVIRPMAQAKIDVKIDVTTASIEDTIFEVSLHTDFKAFNKNDNGNEVTLYLGELIYCNLTRIENIQKESIEPLLFIETPRLMFPFVRSIISNVTRDGGFAPLLLSPFDFVKFYQQRQQT